MTDPYGVDPTHPSADLLTALLRERYGDLRRLERERFTPVVPLRPHSCAAPPLDDISDAQGDLNLWLLGQEVQRSDRNRNDRRRERAA